MHNLLKVINNKYKEYDTASLVITLFAVVFLALILSANLFYLSKVPDSDRFVGYYLSYSVLIILALIPIGSILYVFAELGLHICKEMTKKTDLENKVNLNRLIGDDDTVSEHVIKHLKENLDKYKITFSTNSIRVKKKGNGLSFEDFISINNGYGSINIEKHDISLDGDGQDFKNIKEFLMKYKEENYRADVELARTLSKVNF